MKTWKLVSGILNIVLFVLVSFQSCAAGISNTLENNGELGGSAGVILSIMLLTGGIVSISTRKNEKVGGDIAMIILYSLGALVGYLFADSYTDLKVWASWCVICLLLVDIDLFTRSKKKNSESETIDNTITEETK
ncbi:MAG: hypothetical protein K5675_04590 [Lachnospiraceae bacterium]|nr:hypothetical protein [Lachnospiraceae bacterium]